VTRILVADDDAGIRSVVQDVLAQDGYEVDAVCNGHQAMAAIARHLPALIVLDLDTPGMTGRELIRTLREQTRWGRLPLLIVSGASGATEIGTALGARACLRKPFDLGHLLAAVEQVTPPD
jgi:CheY-like chemotaxis protein